MENSYKLSKFNKFLIGFLIISQILIIVFLFVAPPRHEGIMVDSSQYQEPALHEKIMGTSRAILQTLTTFLAFISVIISFLKMLIAKLDYSKALKQYEEGEKTLEPETLKIKSIIAKKTFKSYLIAGIIVFIVTYFMEVVTSFAKPIIYIYPEENNTKVEISLSHPEDITCSYPKYNNGWNVVANKDGTLKLENSPREYYSLYWEGNNNRDRKIEEGFVVKGKDTANFLEEKLSILGLTDKEAEEFIIYWLPKLEKNNYNLIRFIPIEELNEENELIINPKPDTLIRVMMEFKALPFKIDIKEQQLEKVTREGFTVVEWGGTEL